MASIEGRRGMPRPAPAVPGAPGALEEAEHPEQRRDLREHRADHPQRRRLVRRGRHREEQGHEGLRALGQGQEHRAGRGGDGHDDPLDRLRHRRRRPEQEEVQGRAARRPLGRLRAGVAPGHARRLRGDRQGRRDHGLRRHDRHGRDHLHGRHGALLHGLHPGRVLRQVHALPRGDAPDARDPAGDLRRQGAGGRHREARGALRGHPRVLALRPRADRPEPGALDAALLPRRVRDAHPGEEVPGQALHPAARSSGSTRRSARSAASASRPARARRSPGRRSSRRSSTRPSASSACRASRPARTARSSREGHRHERAHAPLRHEPPAVPGPRLHAGTAASCRSRSSAARRGTSTCSTRSTPGSSCAS